MESDEASVAARAAGCCLATKLAPLGLPQAVCDGLSAQLDALLQLDTADDPRAHCAIVESTADVARLIGRGWPRTRPMLPASAQLERLIWPRLAAIPSWYPS